MADQQNLLNWLKKISFLRSLKTEDLYKLAKELQTISFDADHTIFAQDQEADLLYIVAQGRVVLYIQDYTGEKIILKVAETGDYFGELALLDASGRSATATTTEPTVCYILSRSRLLTFLKQEPSVSLKMLSELTKQIRATNNLLRGRVSRNINTEIAEKLSHSQRLAHWIARFSGSMTFLYLNMLWFAAWIFWNIDMITGLKAFDPYPFGLLTLTVSLEAIFLSIFVLLSQNIQADRDKIHSDIEYEVNLKAELEIAYLHEKIDRFHEEYLNLVHLITEGKKIPKPKS